MDRRSGGPTEHLGVRSPPIISQEPRRSYSTSVLGDLFRGKTQDDSKLQEALNEMTISTKLQLKAAECQRRGVAKLADWARSSRNAAIEDVMGHTNEIFQIHGEKVSQFVKEINHCVQNLRKMQDAELSVKKAESKFNALMDKERKLEKECRKRKGQERETLKHQLNEIRDQREMAERILLDTQAEMEVVKMFRFRNGMKGIADTYMNYTATTAAIFGCQREITEMVPAVSTQDVRRMVYDGMPVTRDRVNNLRRSLESPHEVAKLTAQASQLLGNPRRRSEPARRHRREEVSWQGTPPPPYTPSAPAEDHQSIRVQQSESQMTSPVSSQISSRVSYLHPVPTHQDMIVSPPYGTPASHLHPIPNTAPVTLAQVVTSNGEGIHSRRENRRSLVQFSGCSNGRLYPELPPNPYLAIRAARD